MKAITKPEIRDDKEKIILENFSPIDYWIVVKYSPICDGNYDIFYFSKNSISCLSKVCIYLLLRSKVISSAKCYQNEK
jgi:hypothetical protein